MNDVIALKRTLGSRVKYMVAGSRSKHSKYKGLAVKRDPDAVILQICANLQTLLANQLAKSLWAKDAVFLLRRLPEYAVLHEAPSYCNRCFEETFSLIFVRK